MLFLFWSQVLQVPYWQDDYTFLLNAHIARLAGKPWYSSFVPETKVVFWRPLGMESYWRFVETVLAGNAQLAHLTNVFLIIASSAAVGWFAATLIGLLTQRKDLSFAGVSAAFFYGIHASHFLPAAWAAAANDSLSVFFSALALRFWLVVSTADGRKRNISIPIMLVCLILAFLSRDIAFVLPALGVLLTLWLWPQYRPTAQAWVAGFLCFGISLVWLIAREHFTLPAGPVYEFHFGINIIRNGLLLILFFFNTPYEAFHYFFFVKQSLLIAFWGLVCFVLQVTAFWIFLSRAMVHFTRRSLLIILAFFVISCAPFFFLSWNCYPYYLSIGLCVYAIIIGFWALCPSAVLTVLLLTLLSSSLSTFGNYFLDSRSHVGRAMWTERQLVRMAALRDAQPNFFMKSLFIVVEDNHKFLGFGIDGLSYRLGIDKEKIVVLNPADPAASTNTVLVVPNDGDVYFRQGKDEHEK